MPIALAHDYLAADAAHTAPAEESAANLVNAAGETTEICPLPSNGLSTKPTRAPLRLISTKALSPRDQTQSQRPSLPDPFPAG